jgi:uncharacterized protein with GYD domain
MPYYLYQVAYTPEAWAAQIKNPQDVRQRVQAVMEQNGGKLVGIWYAFGEYDVIGIAEYPDNVSVATVSITFAAGGAVKAAKTTPLMTVEEGMEFLKRAKTADYRPPSS